MSTQRVRLKSVIFFALPVLALLVYYLATLALRPLSVPDEGRYPSIALAMLQSGDFVSPRLNGLLFPDKPALYYWIEAFFLHVAGVSEWSIRLPAALCGITGVLFTMYTAGKLYGRRIAVIAGAVLASSLLYYAGSNYASMDIEVAVFVSISLFCILYGLQQPYPCPRRRITFYIAWIFAALAFMTKGLMGLAFPAIVTGLFVLFTWQWKLVRQIYLPTGLIIFLVICLPWFVLMEAKHPGFARYFFFEQQIVRFSGSGFNNPAPLWFFIPVVIAGMFPWSLLIPAIPGAYRRAGSPHRQAELYLIIWAVALFIFFSIPQSKPVTYILPVFPPVAVLLGRQVDLWIKTGRPAIFIWLVVIVFLIAGAACLTAGFFPEHAGLNVQHIPAAALAGIKFAGLILWFCTITVIWLHFLQRRIAIIVTLVTGTGALFICLNVASGGFNHLSARPLAGTIAQGLKRHAVIMEYRQYFYDLPLYVRLQQPVFVVDNWSDRADMLSTDNWRRELLTGQEKTPENGHWLKETGDLPELLHQYFTLVLTRGDANAVHLQQAYGLIPLCHAGKVVLLTNRLFPVKCPGTPGYKSKYGHDCQHDEQCR